MASPTVERVAPSHTPTDGADPKAWGRTSTCSRHASKRRRAFFVTTARCGSTSIGGRRISCASCSTRFFGRENFLNEIVWKRAPNLGRQAASAQFGRTLDTILVYGKDDAKITPPTRLEPIEERGIRFDEQGRPFTSAPRGDYTDASVERLEAEGRIHRAATPVEATTVTRVATPAPTA